MLGIQIQGEFLDLPPGTALELARSNPFLQLNEKVIGEYSLPVQVKATDKNLRLLQYAAIVNKKMDNSGVDALLYDGPIQFGAGKIKIESADIDLNKTEKGIISFYFLGGASSFWNEIKDTKLRTVNVGGERSFPWLGLTQGGPSNGFWRHIHEVANGAVGDFDYAFTQIINKKWVDTRGATPVYPPIMNRVYDDPNQNYPICFPVDYGPSYLSRLNRIVPFPYLKYIIEKTFEHIGWKLTGDILGDADFQKIIMINFRAIDFAHFEVSGATYSYIYRDPVVFDLKDNLPDITISAFLIALKNRFGWWYDFDNTSKTVTIRNLNELAAGQPVDMTAKASPLITKSVNQDLTVYALKNNFAVDEGNGEPDFKSVLFQGDVYSYIDLPAPDEAQYAHVYLVLKENNYYICLQNEDTEDWEWVLYTYNIYDYEPEGANEFITTEATLVGSELFNPYFDYYPLEDYSPRIDNQGEWIGSTEGPSSWGIHLVFFFGPRLNRDNKLLPYASHHIYDQHGSPLSQWSLAFKAKNTNNEEIGLYDLNWKDYLTMLRSREQFDVKLYLPRHEYLLLKFTKRIVIGGVELFIKEIKATIPYKGSVTCTCTRV